METKLKTGKIYSVSGWVFLFSPVGRDSTRCVITQVLDGLTDDHAKPFFEVLIQKQVLDCFPPKLLFRRAAANWKLSGFSD